MQTLSDVIDVDSFAGGGGASLGIELALGHSPHIAINHDEAAITMHAANHPDTYHYTEDVWHVNPQRACAGRRVRLFWASPDCFPAGTLIITRRGFKPIEDVQVGESVMTHQGRWQPVLSTLTRDADTVSVRGHGHYGLVTTPGHQFYSKHVTKRYPTRKKANGKRVGPVKEMAENPYWPAAKAMPGKLWATPRIYPEVMMPLCCGAEFSDDFFYWLGRWLGDGSLNKGDVEICCGLVEEQELQALIAARPLKNALGETVHPRRVDRGTTIAFVWGNAALASWLRVQFGDSCETKRIPVWCLAAQARWRRAMLDGYLAADGHSCVREEANSVSKALAIGVRLLAVSLGYAAALYFAPGRPGEIEGRKFMGSDQYRAAWRENLQRETVLWDTRHMFSPVREVTPAGRQRVYSLEVAVDESYVADGIVVHNCKHFSRAKGSKPVSKKIRGLAWVVVKWARAVRPETIFLENVREFQDWGSLMKYRKHGRLQYEPGTKTPKLIPNPKARGRTFKRWKRALEQLGYEVQFRVLNAADYGHPTDRRRLFVIARCDGQPICWPEPTHGKPDKQGCVPLGKQPWRTAAECIDWSDTCPSIFLSKVEAKDLYQRTKLRCKRPLEEKTMWRMANGLKRYVIESAKPFLVRIGHYSAVSGDGGSFRGQPVDQPLSTVSAINDKGVVAPTMVKYYGHNRQDQQCDEPLHTVVGKARFAVTPAFLIKANHGVDHMRGQPVNQPLHTITAHRGTGVVQPTAAYLAQIGQTGGHGAYTRSADAPLGTIVSKNQDLACVASLQPAGLTAGHVAKVRGDSIGSDAQAPLPTITAGDGAARPAGAAHAMGVVAAHVTKFYGNGVIGSAAEQPLPTITAIDHNGIVAAHLTKFFGTSKSGADVCQALPTVTADGKHLGIVHAELSQYADETTLAGFWRVYAFLVKYLGPTAPLPIVRSEGQVYLITDVGMRMLKPRELLNAQFTPELARNYKLTGSNANQVAKIGNSVPPLIVKAIVTANIGPRAAEAA